MDSASKSSALRKLMLPGLLLTMALSVLGGCAHHENVPVEEAARRTNDRIVGYEMKQILSGVVLKDGDRRDFDGTGAVYDYKQKFITGYSPEGELVQVPLTDIASVEFRPVGDSALPIRVVPLRKALANLPRWNTDTTAGTAIPSAIFVEIKGRSGKVDTLTGVAEGIDNHGQKVNAPVSSVVFTKLRVPPSVNSPRGIGLVGWINSSRLHGDGDRLALSQDWRSGFDLGAVTNFRVNNRFSVQAELSWTILRSTVYQSGIVDGAQIEISDKMRLSFIEFTLLGKYSLFNASNSDYFIVAGPFVAYPRTVRSQYDSTYSQAGFVLGESGSKDVVNVRDRIFGARVGIELSRHTGKFRPTIGIRYSFAFDPIFTSTEESESDDTEMSATDRPGLPLKLSTVSVSVGFTVPFW